MTTSYHEIKAVSQSFLKRYDDDPQDAVDTYFGDKPRGKATPAQQWGIDLEAQLRGEGPVTVPEDVLNAAESDYVLWEGGTRRGKAWTEFAAEHDGRHILKPNEVDAWHAGGFVKSDHYQAWLGTLDGKRVATPDELLPFLQAENNVREHAEADALVNCPGRQWHVVCRWEMYGGLPCKAELDLLTYTLLDQRCIVDVKSAADTTPDGFAKAAEKWGYHRQAAWYREGYHACFGEWLPFFFVVVGNSGSHAVEVYELDEEWVNAGHQENLFSLERFSLAGGIKQPVHHTTTHGKIETLQRPRFGRYKAEYRV